MSYLMGWSSNEAMFRDFEETNPPEDIEVLYSSYDGGYDGYAMVVFRDADGELRCVEGSHCSCYGLEGQWGPTPTTVAALRRMYPDEERRPKFREFLDSIS